MVSLAKSIPAKPSKSVPRALEDFDVEVATSLDELQRHVDDWTELADDVIEPNSFYEPWMLLPALETFGGNDRWKVLFIYGRDRRRGGKKTLSGVIPLSRQRHGRWPLHVWRMWQHPYCFFCVPLLRNGAAVPTLEEVGLWLRAHRDEAPLWELHHVPAEGPFQHAYLEASERRSWMDYNIDTYTRTVLRVADDAETYCANAMTCHNRQELRRQRRRIAEHGEVELRSSEGTEDLGLWIEQFLDLEARSWKGREGTAFAANQEHRQYLQTICQKGAAAGKAVFLGLFLNGEPLAMKLNFLSPPGSFAFKIAFNEVFAKFSPGVQLELENIDWIHSRPELKMMDSCAVRGHFMINRLWSERRAIQRLLVSTGDARGEAALGMLQAARTLHSVCRKLSRSVRNMFASKKSVPNEERTHPSPNSAGISETQSGQQAVAPSPSKDSFIANSKSEVETVSTAVIETEAVSTH